MTFEKPTRLTAIPVADSRPRVLVIEKGTVLQRLLKRYLLNSEIVPVTDLEAARSALDHTPARLVLVNDHEMSHSLEQFSSGTRFPLNTPTVVCSIAESIEYAPSPDVCDILVKPISRDMLVSAIKKIAAPVKTILITEDEPDAQKLFIRMLASADEGYQVLRAENGVHALNLLQRRKVDAILLDLFMPEMDGYEFLKAKAENEKLRDIPVILISARDPQGHPMVSNFLAATRSGGLSVQQIIDSIQALSAILAPDGKSSALVFQKVSPD